MASDSALQGQTVTVTCHVADAKPPVSTYSFYRNNSLLSRPVTTKNKYTIQNVRRALHFGNYKCIAHNDAGDGESAVIVLDVKGKSNNNN